jgi:hypothetical protein
VKYIESIVQIPQEVYFLAKLALKAGCDENLIDINRVDCVSLLFFI